MVNMPWVDMHCAISAKFGIALFKDLCLIDGRWGQPAIGICALCYI